MNGLIFPTWIMVILVIGTVIKIAEQFSISIKMMYESEHKWKKRVFGKSYKIKMTFGSYIMMFSLIAIMIANWEVLGEGGQILFIILSFVLPLIVAFLTRATIATSLFLGDVPWQVCKWLVKKNLEAAL